MLSFLKLFQKKHQLPDAGADQSTLQLFQYFPLQAVIGNGTAVQGQIQTTRYSPPISIGVHVVVPKSAPITGLGGFQNGTLTTTSLYDRDNPGRTGI